MTPHNPTLTEGPSSFTFPGVLLRAEGLLVLIAALVLYGVQGYSWPAMIVLSWAPDLTILIYALNQRAGAIAYNVVHTYALPVALGVVALIAGWGLGTQIALMWLAHISLDRMLGFGLKYMTNFKDTHMGRV